MQIYVNKYEMNSAEMKRCNELNNHDNDRSLKRARKYEYGKNEWKENEKNEFEKREK